MGFLLTFKLFKTMRELAQSKISESRLEPQLSYKASTTPFSRGFFMSRALGGTSVRRFLVGGSSNLFRPAHQKYRTFRAGSYLYKELKL